MMSLQETIAADAAARLRLPPGRTAAQELARFKTFLKLETHRLKMLHRRGAGGLEICQARAALLDVLLQHLWEAARASLSDPAQREFPPLALVALGGYGRGELNPHSDVDVMFLHAGQVVTGNKPLPHLSRIVDGILYPLWDLGLKVGHAVRTIEECVTIANHDLQSKTALIEARRVAGEERLFQRLQKALVARCVTGQEAQYIAARLADQEARRARFGNSACLQEPNIKNGCGGLRDFHNLLWMAFFKYRARSLGELQERGLLSVSERKQLEAAHDFLLRVRTELHYHTNRAVDVLAKNLQPAVAHNLGYTERSPSRRLERFMRDVYTHARRLFLITRTLEQRLALLPRPRGRLTGWRTLLPGRRPAARATVDGFRFADGQICAASEQVFREDPRRLMRVFLYAQQRGLRLHPDLAQLIRNQLALVDRAFLCDQRVSETFLALLNRRGSVAPILRAMHEVDLLGRYLPEFGKLTCLVQHEFYHQYTADEHTLVCVEQLDRVWEAPGAPHRLYAPLFREVERPQLLYLGLLLHDVGKAAGGGNHAAASARLAGRAARRLGLDEAATTLLCRLIEHHLLMAVVSQRRDLDDPAVLRQFARQVPTPEMLHLLTLLTFVDAQATSDQLWNGFKDSLLRTLHARTLALLTGGSEFLRADEQQRERLLRETHRLLPAGISEEELHAHFATLPPRYFHIHAAPEIAGDLRLAHRFLRLQVGEAERALEPVIGWQDEPDRGYSAVKICTWDRAGLFSHIAGSLSAVGLNILSAQIFTRSDGIALDTFFVADARTGLPANGAQQEQFGALLTRVLTGEPVDFRALIARHKVTRPLYQAYSGERLPTVIRVDNEASDSRTLIEVETEDRIGLLYTLSQTLTQLQLDISAAKICTEKGAALDSFYVSELSGGKVLDPHRQKHIERELRRAIASAASA